MKTLLILLISTLLICSARAEQKIYYHYIDPQVRYKDGPTREQLNNPVEVIKLMQEGWKITHVAVGGGGAYIATVVYILDKEKK